ncbi:potassium transporter TrkA [Sphingopyxis sp. Root214]|jgi:voltage-gated potassium channel|uniref:potassium channel family protein n=1 Tax=unclassified Sphingopyxis TaxID=2614943 RepID=UPI0006FE8FE3|nr:MULTISPECIES: potassium channel family protein [unclassified Sphingopyxis]KQZ72605.1 potassium transporter TrkA [Sphingopyxis sp. Root154]KRC06752.1 potassium transporter TrkA [Sphingopyxis sp. Root214]
MSKGPSDKLKMPHIFRPLKRASNWPIWADVITRLGVAFFLIAIVVLVHWIDRAGLKDSHDGHISFLDVVYFTMISVTTTGFGDIAPVSDRSRLIESIIVTPIRIAVLFIFVGTAYQFALKRTWDKWRMARIQAKLTNHIVVLGFGISGSEAVKELIARGTDPACIVVIDQSASRIAEAETMGCNVLQGDASNDDTLIDVQIARAQSVLVSAGRDDSSILMVLTVRHLSPKVPISVVIRAQDNELLARQAGANNVINPVSFTGLLLAGSAQGAHVADYMADLASIGGRVQLRERAVGAEEIGRSIDQLASGGRGLRIYRSGKPYGFWEPEAQRLEQGDQVVEVVRCEECEASVPGG